jgi:hypothetical protein
METAISASLIHPNIVQVGSMYNRMHQSTVSMYHGCALAELWHWFGSD